MKGLSRRQLLKGGLLATGLAGCDRIADPYALPRPEVPGSSDVPRGQERWIATACGQCASGCGIRVRVVEGRAVKIEGLPEAPVGHGGVGPGGQAGVDVLYAPNRVRGPLKRRGPRGSGTWDEITWPEAISSVARHLGSLREGRSAHRLIVVNGRERGIMNDLWARFCRAYGTPNLFDSARAGTSSPIARAMALATGIAEFPAYDLANSGYVLSLGAGLLEGTCLATNASRALAEARQRPGRRGKLLQVEPTYSLTAASADEWIPVRPGALDVLALSITHVLVREKLHDASFLRESVFGWDDWSEPDGTRHVGMAQQLLAYAPEAVSESIGIDAPTIVRIAHEMASHRPAIAVVDERSVASSNGLSIARAAIVLNAVVGSIGQRGGMQLQEAPPLRAWPAERLDDLAKQSLEAGRIDAALLARHPLGTLIPEALADAIENGSPYAPAAVMLYYASPTVSSAQPERMRQALGKVPLVVSFSPFLDASTEVADYVLPDHTYLERWEDAPPHPSTGFAVLGVRQPAVQPVHRTRHTGDVLLDLSRALGGSIADSMPWHDFKQALNYRLAALAGNPAGEEDFLEHLFKQGYWIASPSDPARGLSRMQTASRRLELFSQSALALVRRAAAKMGRSIDAVLTDAGGASSLDALCLGLPVAAKWVGDRVAFPLTLLTYHPITDAVGGPVLGLLAELGDPLTGSRWGAAAEVNPRVAEALGMADGDEVWVTSPAGRIRSRIRVYGGVPPDVLRIPLGLSADGPDDNPRQLLAASERSELGRVPACSVRVRLTKVTT